MENPLLTPLQSLATSGARAVETFAIDGVRYVGVAQLARDVPGQPAHMNGGDSDIDALLYRWESGSLVECGALPLAGGEDIECFEIGARRFLATAGIRTGRGPYDLNCHAVIYEWIKGEWSPLQRIPTFAAKQWRAFEIDGRHFLALAQGVTLEGVEATNPRTSSVFEWDGECFAPFQTFDGPWGYDWIHTTFRGKHYLAYADQLGGSIIYQWSDAGFEVFQRFDEKGGRTFRFFEERGELWMVHVNLLSHTTLYRFDDQQFVAQQSLGGAGGRELCVIDGLHGRYLLLARFITGTPQAAVVETQSQLFKWKDDAFELVEEFATSAATDATTFIEGGTRYVVVSNSLSESIRFSTPSTVYRFNG